MGHAVPTPSEMFSDANGTDVVRRFEEYKGALSAEHAKAAQGGRGFAPGQGIVEDPAAKSRVIAERIENLTKGLGTDVVASVQGEIDAIKNSLSADIGKDWSLPPAAGNATLVPYDLEAPAKLLVPRLTPLRNEIPRGKGQGTARQYRRILGFSNTGFGGVADKSPFMDSQTATESFGPMSLRRGKKIEYASDDKSVSYMEMSLSDQVNWVSQFAGQGFQDIRSLSQTALLWAHLGGEERAVLYGRGAQGNGYAGTVAAPVISASKADTGGSVPAGTYAIVVTAQTGFGETAASNSPASITVASGDVGTLSVTVTTQPVGSLGVYNLYVSAAGGAASTAKFQTQFVGTTATITSVSTTGRVSPAAVDNSFQPRGYDGFLTVQSGPDSGYYKNHNAILNAANAGEEFQDAFLSLYTSVKADPDHIWVDGGTAKQLGDLLKKQTGASSYRLQLDGDAQGHFLGSVVTGIENQVTRKMVPFNVHPWMPQGCALIRSATLPIPDSHVSATAEIISVQEYMSVDWPVVQFTYDSSTYWYGTMVHYAPAWSGLITGIKAA